MNIGFWSVTIQMPVPNRPVLGSWLFRSAGTSWISSGKRSRFRLDWISCAASGVHNTSAVTRPKRTVWHGLLATRVFFADPRTRLASKPCHTNPVGVFRLFMVSLSLGSEVMNDAFNARGALLQVLVAVA